MSGTSGSGGVGALTIGGVATVVVIIGGVVLNQYGVFDQSAEPVAVATQVETPKTSEAQIVESNAADEASKDTQAPQDDATDEVSVAEGAPLAPPEIDLIRFDPEGAGLIAGSAAPGARVFVLLDGEIILDQIVGESGEFVLFPIIRPSDAPRVVTFELEEGEERIASDVSFILAPVTPAAPAEGIATADVSPAAEAEDGDTADVVEEPQTEVARVEEVPAEVTEPAAPEPEEAPVIAAETVSEEVAVVDPPVDVAEALSAQPAPNAEEITTAEVEVPNQDGLNLTETVGQAPAQTTEHRSANIAVVRSSEAQPAQAPAIALQSPPQPVPPVEEQPRPLALTATVDVEADSAPQAVAVLKAGPDGIEVVQPAAPSVPELSEEVALDTISYSAAGDVVLAGRARPQSLVRIYVDNAPWADISTAPSGAWQGELEGLDPGVYTLRLDEVDRAEGKVLSRLETPFSRAEPELLAQSTTGGDGAATVRAVTVQEGDTLWAISQKRYGSGFLFVRVFEANRETIRNPDLIYPGQVFALPE